MNAREDWLNARRCGIGGSDVAAILGLSPWKSAVDVYLDKTGQTPHSEENEAMYWGTRLEDVVADEYRIRTSRNVQRIKTMIAHHDRTWQMANLDRVIVTPGSRARWDGSRVKGADGILECKTTSAFNANDWAGEGELPVYYTTQVMHYMDVTSLPFADVAVLIGGNHYERRTVEYDAEVAREIRERCAEFWFKHVIENIPPEPKNGAETALLYPQDTGSSIEADAELLNLIIQAGDLRTAIKADETALDTLVDAIKVAIKDASTVTVQGKTLLTWKAAKPSQKTDWKAIVADLNLPPEAIEPYTTTTPGSRRLLWKD
jgi:putative phage-type endonuclease